MYPDLLEDDRVCRQHVNGFSLHWIRYAISADEIITASLAISKYHWPCEALDETHMVSKLNAGRKDPHATRVGQTHAQTLIVRQCLLECQQMTIEAVGVKCFPYTK
jgi:hypothetical protein